MSADTTPSLFTFFEQDHRRCDTLWVQVENAVDSGDAAVIETTWRAFDHALRQHFAMEEETMFPAFEAASGMTGGGPTFVMRHEHQQMRGVLDQMADAVQAGDPNDLLGQGDTLHLLVQQHNAKEEGMLYPMADRVLQGEWPTLLARLRTYQER
ncbi:MAG: hemerythrin domain-containing protein [Deltaproteobacteria bacterium]|nr:hemerythrin domain-containing protein [Deltaproteobacteria bacterium]MBW2254818.1 hemerythrin domain-containing protein [Deltaproteobacteria bacterium]